MTAVMLTECAGETVETPSNGGTVPEWFERHAEAVVNAANTGALPLAGKSRLYTTWPVDGTPPTHTHLTIRYNGPPPESDNDFLNRHLQEVAGAFSSHPPIP